MKPDKEQKSQGQGQGQNKPEADAPLPTPGTALYGTITDYSQTPNNGMQQLIHWDLDSRATYEQQSSPDRGGTWVPFAPNVTPIPPGATEYNGGLQIPGGVPVRLVVK